MGIKTRKIQNELFHLSWSVANLGVDNILVWSTQVGKIAAQVGAKKLVLTYFREKSGEMMQVSERMGAEIMTTRFIQARPITRYPRISTAGVLRAKFPQLCKADCQLGVGMIK